MNGDWRGEHLIRAKPRDFTVDQRGVAKRHGSMVSRAKRPKPERKVCAVPGCGAKLNAQAKSGVCHAHCHAKGFCSCTQCGEENWAR